MHTGFLNQILENNITAVVDEEVRSMPPRKTRYKGSFNILRISDDVPILLFNTIILAPIIGSLVSTSIILEVSLFLTS